MKRVYSGIGGQAVIEGIMMKNKDEYAVAVRKTDGEIVYEKKKTENIQDRSPFFKWPIVRGVVAFVDSLVLGLSTLTFSASFFEDEDGEQMSKKESDALMGAAVVIAIIAAVAIFMLLPMFLSTLVKKVVSNEVLIAFIEGIIRIAIFVLYIKLISRMDDINRTFMYHGAEHKCINCVELGNDLTVENVMASSKEHKRCGTSFLIIVMIISILFFMVIRIDNLALRALSRIILIPVIAGVSYEFLRIAGRSESPIVNALSRPGMWMQGLTTKEPTADMVEVAIKATEQVFDWKGFLTENFGKTFADDVEEVVEDAAESVMEDAETGNLENAIEDAVENVVEDVIKDEIL